MLSKKGKAILQLVTLQFLPPGDSGDFLQEQILLRSLFSSPPHLKAKGSQYNQVPPCYICVSSADREVQKMHLPKHHFIQPMIDVCVVSLLFSFYKCLFSPSGITSGDQACQSKLYCFCCGPVSVRACLEGSTRCLKGNKVCYDST